MTYVLTQDLVHPEARALGQGVLDQMQTCIIGGNAQLFRYNDEAERPQIHAGPYDPVAGNRYPYPDRPFAGRIALESVRVFLDEVLLEFYSGDDFEVVGGQPDRLRTINLTLAGERSPIFYDRDVHLGDIITVTSADGQTFRAAVKGMVGDTEQAFIGKAVPVDSNIPYDNLTIKTGGSYTGNADIKYLIEVLDYKRIKVSTITGSDIVRTLDAEVDKPIAVGSKGVTITFSGIVEIPADNAFTIDVKASGVGAVRTLLMSRNLPPAMRDAKDLTVSLSIVRYDLELSSDKYHATDQEVTVLPNLLLLDSDWTRDGEPRSLPVTEAAVYIQYKSWCNDYADKVYDLPTVSAYQMIPGQDHPSNPLKSACRLARMNSNNTAVKFIAVEDPGDLQSWVRAINKLSNQRIYSFVALSNDRDVQALIAEQVHVRSEAENGRECVMWVPIVAETLAAIADASNSDDGTELLATVTPAPGDGVMIFDVPAGNAQFMDLDVRSGDIVRYDYGEDVYGNVSYQEYVVRATLNEDALAVYAGPELAVCGVPKKIEVWRMRDADELCEAIGDVAREYANKRIRAVWPDKIRGERYTFDGYHMCAALAGLRSGCAPHQDLAGVEIMGFEAAPRTTELFTWEQLDEIASAGVWIVTEEEGDVITRKGLTTAEYGDPSVCEESAVTNLDSINKALKEGLVEVLGKMGSTRSIKNAIRAQLQGSLNALSVILIPRLGKQIVDSEIRAVRRHTFMPDRVVVSLRLVIPMGSVRGLSADTIEVYQSVIA